MRSLRYRLTGTPQTVDDCVEYARRHSLTAIRVERFVQYRPTDITVYVEFVARITWCFDPSRISCNVVCGAYREDGVGDDATSAKQQAEAYLQNLLKKHPTTGIDVVASGEGWTFSFSTPGTGEMNYA